MATATQMATATPTATTPPPTPTFTPTPTALPIAVTASALLPTARPISPEAGAPCGVVDYFDFALDPPDGDGARLRQPFANQRRQFSFHAGEDWVLAGAPSFGVAVYSIGLGQVTYAAPNGWGTDRGVVIVRHQFQDGSSILSFYGHLDPPSVTLRSGECVRRGEQVGAIGRPRTPPHLHLELRTHMPDEPGPGYWGVGLTDVGWEPPSQIIWESRHAVMPGIQWHFRLAPDFIRILGPLGGDIFAVLTGGRIYAVDAATGLLRWRRPPAALLRDGLLSSDGTTIYTLDEDNVLAALPVAALESDNAFAPPAEPAWTRTFTASGTIGTPSLLPLGEGGVLLSIRQLDYETDTRELSSTRTLQALAADGRELWQLEMPAPILGEEQLAGVLAGNRLLFTAGEGQLWAATRAGPPRLLAELEGRLNFSQDGRYLYTDDGLYRLDGDAVTGFHLLTSSPRTPLQLLSLPDNSLFAIHHDRYARRLLAFDGSGELRWQRSLAGLEGEPHLKLLAGRPYLLLQQDTNAFSKLTLYALHPGQISLSPVFAGGGPLSAFPHAAEIFALEDRRLFLAIRGSSALLLDADDVD